MSEGAANSRYALLIEDQLYFSVTNANFGSPIFSVFNLTSETLAWQKQVAGSTRGENITDRGASAVSLDKSTIYTIVPWGTQQFVTFQSFETSTGNLEKSPVITDTARM